MCKTIVGDDVIIEEMAQGCIISSRFYSDLNFVTVSSKEDAERLIASLHKMIRIQFSRKTAVAGDIMPLSDFLSRCFDGRFTDDDGHGKYSTIYERTNVIVYPSDVTLGRIRFEYPYVIWYKK
jgi:hypothetical protein